MARKRGLSYKELLERFIEKVNLIPEECRSALFAWHMAREVQAHRIALENKLRQVIEAGKKVFWASLDLPPELKATKLANLEYIHDQHRAEDKYVRIAEKLFEQTRWYHEVAVAAAEGVGMGPMLAGDFLWYIASPSRFASFGKLVKYAGLHVVNGKAPKMRKGEKVDWCPALRAALFKLTEVWNKMPDCVWRARWDAWKAYYTETRPEILEEVSEDGVPCGKGHIHNMARRKIQREFLRNLYNLWKEYEERMRG